MHSIVTSKNDSWLRLICSTNANHNVGLMYYCIVM